MLEEAIKALEKKFGKNTICIASDMPGLEIERVSTGSLALDIVTGGGVPRGRVIEIFGDESSGKTTQALRVVVEFQKLGEKVVWIDVEGTLDRVWAKTIGVDLGAMYLSVPDTGELACDVLDTVVRSGDCGLVVFDSVAALIPEGDIDTSMEDNQKVGGQPSMVSRVIRKLQSALNVKVGEGDDLCANQCTIIFINQIREKIGVMYGNPEFSPGGHAIKHACSIRLNFRRGDWIKKGEAADAERIGNTIKFKTVKNKTYPPWRTGEFDFYFTGKIDRTKEVVSYAILNGLIQQEGAFYTLNGDKIKGKEKLLEMLEEKPDITTKLEQEIRDITFKESGVK